MLMAEKKKKPGWKKIRDVRPKFGKPAWLRDDYEETQAEFSDKGRYTKRAFDAYLSKDVCNAPGVVFLGLKDAIPMVVGKEMMVQGIAPDGLPIMISHEEAMGEVDILSWHEIYEVRCAEVRKNWSEYRYRIEKYGFVPYDDRPNVIPTGSLNINTRKKLSAD